MNLRQARKILLAGRPLLPENGRHGARPCAQEQHARKIVVDHWGHHAYPGGLFTDTADRWCHADNRALNASEGRMRSRGAQ